MTIDRTDTSEGLVAFVRRNQLSVFVILAYALSWWAWIWYRLDPGNVDAPILPIGPLLATLIVLAIIGGWPAIKALFAKIVHWRVGWPVVCGGSFVARGAYAFGCWHKLDDGRAAGCRV